MNLARDNFPELRDAVRQLCSQFDSAYWQKIDEQRAYPEAFVEALTKAGWMSALIPEEYGGSGLSLTEATVIMEEVTRSGGNAGCCHGQHAAKLTAADDADGRSRRQAHGASVGSAATLAVCAARQASSRAASLSS